MEPHPERGEQIDGAALHGIVRRFRAHHAFRIARTGERLISRHRRVLEALPMLYHRNHPALPGYAGPDVPHGIAGYRPAHEDVQALRAVARSYVDRRLAAQRQDLHAIYLMGSGGTIGQTRRSDIDLWVCCDSLLHAALWPKVRLIDRWAAELGLELQTFLVDPEVLRTRRRLPGTRIPMLVLDEFYRTGALMAGRFPLWWLMPHDDPERYPAMAERLRGCGFVDPAALVDFGPVAKLRPAELAQAAIIELDRALVTPHKSLLKLMLMEAYARTPQLGVVSTEYRRRIHAGEAEPLTLDPYLLLYEHVERHLQSGQQGVRGRRDELIFARTLLIGKAAESLSWRERTAPAAAPLAERFAGWGFGADEVARFRDLDGWSMRERRTEHRRIMAALERGIALVDTLVREAMPSRPGVSEDDRQLRWLNETRLRKLRAAVARLAPRDPQCIPRLHPALVSRRRPIALMLARHAGRWVVREGRHVVRPCRRLVEAVAWCELNGANLVPAAAEGALTRSLAQVVQALRESARPLCVIVNAEAGEQRVPPWQSGGTDSSVPGSTLLSRRNDPLDYGGFHQLHLETLDLVQRGLDGQWRVDSLVDADAVLDGLGQLLIRPAADASWQVIGGHERFQLAQRLERLHRLASRILEEPDAVFVLPFGSDTVTVRRRDDGAETRRHRSLEALQHFLQSSGCGRFTVDPVSVRLRAMLRTG